MKERPVAFRGSQKIVVYALAGREAAPDCPGLEFYDEKCDIRQQAKLNKLFSLIGDRGWINNKEKFKPIEGTDFYEFKDFQIRMPCFFHRNLLVITHGFVKKSNAIPPTEIARAKRIREEDRRIEKFLTGI